MDIKWHKATDKLPAADKDENGTPYDVGRSVECLVYTKYGARTGRYVALLKIWQVSNVHGDLTEEGVGPIYWAAINDPI